MVDNSTGKMAYDGMVRFKVWVGVRISKIKAKIWLKKIDLKNALWLLKRACLTALGKEGIMDSRAVYAKGGWKYTQLELTKFPVNRENAP